MPPANRQFVPGYLWHITHRSHEKTYLLNCARYRRRYRRTFFNARRQGEKRGSEPNFGDLRTRLYVWFSNSRRPFGSMTPHHSLPEFAEAIPSNSGDSILKSGSRSFFTPQ